MKSIGSHFIYLLSCSVQISKVYLNFESKLKSISIKSNFIQKVIIWILLIKFYVLAVLYLRPRERRPSEVLRLSSFESRQGLAGNGRCCDKVDDLLDINNDFLFIRKFIGFKVVHLDKLFQKHIKIHSFKLFNIFDFGLAIFVELIRLVTVSESCLISTSPYFL